MRFKIVFDISPRFLWKVERMAKKAERSIKGVGDLIGGGLLVAGWAIMWRAISGMEQGKMTLDVGMGWAVISLIVLGVGTGILNMMRK